ncbi:Alpha/Beta hydrolase protein [Suillus paluster]|uniref:Alpha/Beta hydrolase protein n=1 Tax=Suillus paluster TaxID=48578 RepID=UPI001B8659D1|nr:Alpha/Beta hydrolase protein [Suillus paluster]KAG1730281.1 Alpha/Beta hydrolase protein [Suillus paluster]
MLGAIFGLLNLALFKDFSGVLEQIPLVPTGDLGYATYQGNQRYPNAVNSGTTVDLGYVTYQGKLDEAYPNTVVYFGIPYAEPPVGDLRFRPTVPLNTTRVTEEANGEVVNATDHPNFCIQGSLPGKEGGAGSEDCLNVNIYTPFGATEGDNLPVMFFIHGGAFVFGNPPTWPFDHWIEQSPNVIIVSVYYRLASFGFLPPPPEFADQFGYNAGLKDQRQALRWVQSYISKFGGNPNEVTIAGHSAGAISSVVRSPLPTPEQQQPLFDFYAREAGCDLPDALMKMSCIRMANVSMLAAAQDAAFQELSLEYRSFGPVVDDVLITGHPTSKFQCGDFAHVPLLVGATSDESLIPEMFPNISVALKVYFPLLTDTDIQQFLWLYPLDDFDSPSQQYQVITGELSARCNPQAMGVPSSRYSDDLTWTYRYNTPKPRIESNIIPVEHADEIWMMFNGTKTGPNGTFTFQPQTLAERAFASEIIAYWLSFVRSSKPNTYKLDKSPVWGAYNESKPVRVVLMQDPQNSTNVTGSYMEEQPVPETVRCAFAISKAEVCQN